MTINENRMREHSFVFNQDCDDVIGCVPPGNAQEWLRELFIRTFAAGVRVFVADVAMPDVVDTKETPTGEINGARFSNRELDTEVSVDGGAQLYSQLQWYRGIAELMEQDTDILHMACEEGHKAGSLVLAGMRMSDAHHGCAWQVESDNPMFAQFVMDHPEWCNTWDDDEVMLSLYGRLDATLNYTIPEVQAHRLQILRELATNYDIDGLELNWMRWCRHFPAGRQREYLDVLTDFVRQVREMLDEVALIKGVERMILGHRVPVTLNESLDIGCDVETWAKEGYADFLAPMDFFFNDLNIQTDEFVRACGDTGCLVYPSFGTTKYTFGSLYRDTTERRPWLVMNSLAQFRATAANWYAWGAQGGSSFNMYNWSPEHQDFYKQVISILSNPTMAISGQRHYVYLPVWKDASLPEHRGNAAWTGRYNAQMLVFSAETAGTRQTFSFCMADGRNGEKLEGILRFRIYDAVSDDLFAVDINSIPIHTSKIINTYLPNGEIFNTPEETIHLSVESFTWPPHVLFEISLSDCPSFKGSNQLGIRLRKLMPGRDKNPVMEALEIIVM